MSVQEAIDLIKGANLAQPLERIHPKIAKALSLLEQVQQQEAFDHAKRTVASWPQWKKNASRLQAGPEPGEFTSELFRDMGHEMYSRILEACDRLDRLTKENKDLQDLITDSAPHRECVEEKNKLLEIIDRLTAELENTVDSALCDVWIKRASEAEAENKRLAARDCNATIELAYDDGINPFAREELKVVDVGVSDNCYVVESEILKQKQAENKAQAERIEKQKRYIAHASYCAVHRPGVSECSCGLELALKE